MSTVSVNVEYRPVRIGWCVDSGSFEQLEKAIRLTSCLYGGRYNPIIPTNSKEFSENLIRLYGVDALHPLGTIETKESLEKKFPWLLYPGIHSEIFIDTQTERASSTYLDISHILRHISGSIEWREAYHSRLRVIDWDKDDPMHYVNLCMFGGFPDVKEIGIDYSKAICDFSRTELIRLDKSKPIDPSTFKSISPLSLTRLGLEHSRNHFGWTDSGVYVGDASDFWDIVHFWNLRAANAKLLFCPVDDSSRIDQLLQDFLSDIRRVPSDNNLRKHVVIWSRKEIPKELHSKFGEGLSVCRISEHTFNGLNLSPTKPCFPSKTVIGSLEEEDNLSRLTVPLIEKPFDDHAIFMCQRVAVKIHPYGGKNRTLLKPPYIPQLNEYYGRKYHHAHDCVRSERDGAVIIMHVSDNSLSLRSLVPTDFFQKLFGLIGLSAKPSYAGRICTQVISQFEGLQGCRLFKIPGVRALIKRFRPDQAFSLGQAFGEINRGLDQHKHLYLEPREDKELTASHVFRYMQKKRAIRTGVEFDCPRCELKFWLSLDDCKSQIACPYCEQEFLSEIQLKNSDAWSYRRSGIFGVGSDPRVNTPSASVQAGGSDSVVTDNQQGSIPVALVLQQLDVNLGMSGISAFYPGLAFKPISSSIPACEVDLVLIVESPRSRTQVLLGECKDEKCKIEPKDAKNLNALADALEEFGMEPYILFAKTGAFSPDEIEVIRTTRSSDRSRVIVLTDNELEPYYIGDGYPKIKGIEEHPISLDRMALNSDLIYLADTSGTIADKKADTVNI